MKRILVAVDGSERSLAALRWAAHVADRLGASTTALAVAGKSAHLALDVPPGLSAPEEDLAVVAALEKAIADAGLAGVKAAVMHGRPSDALHDAAASPDVIALAMGTRGLGTVPGLLLGSLSRRMLFDCANPLLLVPDRSHLPVLDRAVVAVDGSPISLSITTWSAELCARLGIPAAIVRCVDPGAELPPGHVTAYLEEARTAVESNWCQPFRDHGVAYEALALRGDPRRRLIETADERRAGLLVVAGRGEGQFQGLGGTTSYLVRHSAVPLAVVPCDEAWPPNVT